MFLACSYRFKASIIYSLSFMVWATWASIPKMGTSDHLAYDCTILMSHTCLENQTPNPEGLAAADLPGDTASAALSKCSSLEPEIDSPPLNLSKEI